MRVDVLTDVDIPANSEIIAGYRLINEGPTRANNITVSVKLPATLVANVSAVVPSGSSYDGGTELWTVPSLGPGSQVTLNLRHQVTNCGLFSYVGEVTAVTEPDIDSTVNDATGDDYELSTSNCGITIGPKTIAVNEAGSSKTLSLRLTTDPGLTGEEVTVTLTIVDDTEITINGVSTDQTFTFNGDNWNTAQVITIAGADDAIIDGRQSFNINADATADSSVALDFAGLAPDFDIAVINDDDGEGSILRATNMLVKGTVVSIGMDGYTMTSGSGSGGSATETAGDWEATMPLHPINGTGDVSMYFAADGEIDSTVIIITKTDVPMGGN